jgi:hypothetical protein
MEQLAIRHSPILRLSPITGIDQLNKTCLEGLNFEIRQYPEGINSKYILPYRFKYLPHQSFLLFKFLCSLQYPAPI